MNRLCFIRTLLTGLVCAPVAAAAVVKDSPEVAAVQATYPAVYSDGLGIERLIKLINAEREKELLASIRHGGPILPIDHVISDGPT